MEEFVQCLIIYGADCPCCRSLGEHRRQGKICDTCNGWGRLALVKLNREGVVVALSAAARFRLGREALKAVQEGEE